LGSRLISTVETGAIQLDFHDLLTPALFPQRGEGRVSALDKMVGLYAPPSTLKGGATGKPDFATER
jgi:hypothetical protein